MLPKILRPIKVNDLIRIGNKFDGGYVITKSIFKKIKQLVTFGLFDEFSFEQDLKKKIPKLEIFVFDHTVNINFWIKNTFRWLFHFLINGKNFSRIFRCLKYYIFFNKKKIIHIKKKIVSSKRREPNSISINEIIKNYNIVSENCIIKIDIDLDEYRILDDLIKFNFLIIIIEFSHIDLHLDKVINFIKKNKKMSIIHLHGNNFDWPDENQNPIHLEITFLNNRLCKVGKKKSNQFYPIKGLDYPNDFKKPEINLKFSK
ncbi:hypothetical protein [Candidatus Fonsibacter ubiquis]|uniref:hypothetical protein n=1 Tax=Candidatus Fonsibacter ubiquis TaxID=1925548 RepID=UPI000C072EE4|nr:hypothetical protein [Candidatus Fonsibacter ubiquis]